MKAWEMNPLGSMADALRGPNIASLAASSRILRGFRRLAAPVGRSGASLAARGDVRNHGDGTLEADSVLDVTVGQLVAVERAQHDTASVDQPEEAVD